MILPDVNVLICAFRDLIYPSMRFVARGVVMSDAALAYRQVVGARARC
jgi:hypothetical protein